MDPTAGHGIYHQKNLYFEYISRDFVSNQFELIDGMKVCNVGIGAGEWDDYLGYWLKDKGTLTSIDIDKEICEFFTLRQKIEQHSNPSNVICEDVMTTTAPKAYFNLVTIIGSAIQETGAYHRALSSCFDLVKENGYLMYMDFVNFHCPSDFEEYLKTTTHEVVDFQLFDKYPDIKFYVFKVKK